MKYICFAGSPLQLICIKELLYKKKIEKYAIYLLMSRNVKVNNQMYQTAKILNLKNIKKYKRHQIKIIEICQRFIFLLKLFFLYKNKEIKFVITDFLNTFTHSLRCLFKKSKFILVDDGFATYWQYRKYMQKGIYFPVEQLNSFFKRIVKFIFIGFQFKYLLFQKFEIFTIYAKELGLAQNSYNRLEYIKNFLKKRNKLKYSNSIVYLTGTKFFESGKLTLEQELHMINKINIYWNKKGKKLIYVAKRTSSNFKLKMIKEKLFIKVIIFDLPLELALMVNYKKKIPTIICSLGSATDKTVPMIYENIKTYWIVMNSFKTIKFFNNYFNFFKEFMLKSYSKKHIIRL
jgi:hypothetical protein